MRRTKVFDVVVRGELRGAIYNRGGEFPFTWRHGHRTPYGFRDLTDIKRTIAMVLLVREREVELRETAK